MLGSTVCTQLLLYLPLVLAPPTTSSNREKGVKSYWLKKDVTMDYVLTFVVIQGFLCSAENSRVSNWMSLQAVSFVKIRCIVLTWSDTTSGIVHRCMMVQYDRTKTENSKLVNVLLCL